MTKLEVVKLLKDIFENTEVMVNDDNWENYDTDPDTCIDYHQVMKRLSEWENGLKQT